MSYEVKSLNEECGIFGVWGHPDAARVTYFGLHSLQHRGQEGAGIVVNQEGILDGYRGLGLLSEVFKDERQLNNLKGTAAIGHVDMQLQAMGVLIIFSHFYLNFTILL